MPKNKGINLLPQEEFDVSIIGRALKWAMGTFRIIVIVTEMVVMSAFLSRFWLDAQNSDLTGKIKIKTAQIEAQKEIEIEFRSLQSKLNIIKQIDAASPLSQKINAVASKLPSGVNLATVSVLENSATIKGTSTSEIGIAQFVANLKADPVFKTVELGQITSSEIDQTQVIFSIDVSY